MIRTLILHDNFNSIKENLNSEFYNIDDDGSVFCIFKNEYDKDGNVLHDFLDIIDYGISIGYDYINTIVYPTNSYSVNSFMDNVKYIVWLCKSYQSMYFNKDRIREKHIWKDVEWGKRKKNYNPKGKDPGNVWIPTEDDGKGTITEHILLSDEDVIDRLIKMTDAEDSNIIKYNSVDDYTIDQPTIDKRKGDTVNNNPSGKVIFGTSEKMDEIQDDSVDLVVTSPPYWDLKDYFKEGQIGQESYDQYLLRMESVWKECYRKMKPNGSLWININIRKRNGNTILIPRDIVNSCKKIGFHYKGILIWHKSSGIPTNNKNIVDRHEYVLIFSKDINFSVEFDVFSGIHDYKNDEINGGAFWNINRKAGSVGKKYIHPAIYPNQLVERIVLCTTSENNLVLDPFIGSGTSLISSLLNNRNFIGYEYNENFESLMRSRFEKEIPNYLEKVTFLNQ